MENASLGFRSVTDSILLLQQVEERGLAGRDLRHPPLHCDLDVVLRSDKRTDRFVPMPKKWIVERTFSWLENFRRLTIDYEYSADTHEAMLHIAAIKLEAV